MDLVRKPGEDACLSVTAEIIPHFRPTIWEKDILDRLVAHARPVRVTGHLFFDSPHKPCESTTKRASPPRISLWEIHPVYSIEVCQNETLNTCPAKEESKWVSLDQWLTEHASEEDTEDNHE